VKEEKDAFSVLDVETFSRAIKQKFALRELFNDPATSVNE